MKHVTLYREEGRYAGWPANYGIWCWENEIVVGFTVGTHNPDEERYVAATVWEPGT